MSHKRRTKTTTGSHVKVTARHKVDKIEKEIKKLEPLPTAKKAVDSLLERLQFWKSKL